MELTWRRWQEDFERGRNGEFKYVLLKAECPQTGRVFESESKNGLNLQIENYERQYELFREFYDYYHRGLETQGG